MLRHPEKYIKMMFLKSRKSYTVIENGHTTDQGKSWNIILIKVACSTLIPFRNFKPIAYEMFQTQKKFKSELLKLY